MLRGKLGERVQEFVDAFPHFGTPEGARNHCIDASMTFLELYGVEQHEMYLHMNTGQRAHRRADKTYDPVEEHHWVKIGNKNIDFTARQYSVNAPYPQIWDSP